MDERRAGGVRPTATVKPSGARITSLGAAASLNANSASGIEEVRFTYRQITLTVPIVDNKGATTGGSSVAEIESGYSMHRGRLQLHAPRQT